MCHSKSHPDLILYLQWLALAAALALTLLPLVAAQSAQAQTYTVLHTFTGGADGGIALGRLTRDAAGNLYGTTWAGGDFGGGTVFKLDPSGNETVLHAFSATPDDAGNPMGGVTRYKGALYGTSWGGGPNRYGTVYKVDLSGNFTLLFSLYGSFGQNPNGGVIVDAKGNIYGTAAYGGAQSAGTVFAIDSAGNASVLHAFNPNKWDGRYPNGGLLGDTAGNIYGTTTEWGNSGNMYGGMVFSVSKKHAYTPLYNFTAGADGRYPQAGLIRDEQSNLYGTTAGGGTFGVGTVYKIDTAGNHTVLYSFSGGADGLSPWSSLARDAAGNLYGTTSGGIYDGSGKGFGTVFKLDTSGTLTTLYAFNGGSDGQWPQSPLLLDAAGNLYGTANGVTFDGACGILGCGVVFKISVP